MGWVINTLGKKALQFLLPYLKERSIVPYYRLEGRELTFPENLLCAAH